MFKLFCSDRTFVGETLEDWDGMPWRDVQFVLVKLDPDVSGKSRVGWYRDNPGLWGEYAYYWWGVDGYPEGVTPDAVLDRWAELTGKTDITLADLSLDDFRKIGVKIGRTVESELFERILALAINDESIR